DVRRHAVLRIAKLTQVKAVVAGLVIEGVVEGAGEEITQTLHRMLLPGHGVLHVVEHRGQRFANGRVAETNGEPTRDATDDAALDRTLRVDDEIVMAFLQVAVERREFTAAPGLDEGLAPATKCYGNDLVD